MNFDAIKLLDENTDQLIKFVSAINEDVAQTTPPSGKWSIIQICDHLMSVDFGVYSLMSLEGTVASEDRESKTEIIAKVGADRSVKVKAPPPLVPKGKTDTLEKFKAKFPSLRAKMKTAVEAKDAKLVCDKFPHFVLGTLTFEEWLYFSTQHANRHKMQMQEVLEELKLV